MRNKVIHVDLMNTQTFDMKYIKCSSFQDLAGLERIFGEEWEPLSVELSHDYVDSDIYFLTPNDYDLEFGNEEEK